MDTPMPDMPMPDMNSPMMQGLHTFMMWLHQMGICPPMMM